MFNQVKLIQYCVKCNSVCEHKDIIDSGNVVRQCIECWNKRDIALITSSNNESVSIKYKYV